ncbi:MAG: hypothetical protein RIS80_1328 [Actinomycetota bacterium]
MKLEAVCERTAEGWDVEIPALDNLKTSAKRLDKVEQLIRDLAKNHPLGGGDCELVIQVIAKMPGIICDVEAAQEKMREATRLQEEASEIRSVVGRMREEGLTMRDIAVVLGVTPQRVAQLAACETETESCPN